VTDRGIDPRPARAGAALVTGGAQRLGAAMVRELARRGHAVAIHCHASRAAAEALAAEVADAGGRAVVLAADLLDRAATARLVPEAAAALGAPLSVLVNNASIFEHDTIATATWESWDRHVGSNLRAPFELTQAFAAQAPAAGRDAEGEPVARAAVVNLLDQRIRKLTPEFATYTIAKMGLWALTRTAAQGLAPAVRVMAIAPGPTLRGIRQSEAHFAAQRAATVLGRGASAAEIAATLGFILDSPGLTGQVICVDGGQHLAWATPDVLGVE
jgi:NAD(P)-dependent dehydrogenase (short-subunit alcohol dehydrogenase family)